MAYKVSPTFNDATGDYTGQVVETSMHHGVKQSIDPVQQAAAEQDPAFAPAKNPAQFHRGLAHDASEAEISDFWQSDRPLSGDEISRVQDHITALGSHSDEAQMFARLLDYRVTGRTDSLQPDDFELLGVPEPDPNAMTYQEIDNLILTSDDPEPNQQNADWIASLQFGSTPAHVAVQHLTAQVYAGRLSAQQAYFKAFTTGIPDAQLYRAFQELQEVIG